MADRRDSVTKLHAALGHKPLNRTWAKLEILLGLIGAGAGILLGQWELARSAEVHTGLVAGALVLFVLGGYLALAGSRSHLYQSNNELTAYLIEEIHRLKEKADLDEHSR